MADIPKEISQILDDLTARLGGSTAAAWSALVKERRLNSAVSILPRTLLPAGACVLLAEIVKWDYHGDARWAMIFAVGVLALALVTWALASIPDLVTSIVYPEAAPIKDLIRKIGDHGSGD